MVNYISHFDQFKAEITSVPDLRMGQTRFVCKTGGDYTSIQAAINSISDASAAKPYVVRIRAGVYAENIVLKDYVYLKGEVISGVTIQGNITGTLSNSSGISSFTLLCPITGEGQTAITISGGAFTLKEIAVVLTGTGDYTAYGVNLSAGTGYTVSDSTVTNRMTYAGITKNFVAWEFNGVGSYGLNYVNVSDRVDAASGTRTAYQITGTGSFSFETGLSNFTNTHAAATAVIQGFNVTSASTAARATNGLTVRMQGTSGGTAIGFLLDSGGNSAEVQHIGNSVFVTGFPLATSLCTRTGTTDTQKVWLNSTNIDLTTDGVGLAIITPYVLQQTGFIQWSSAVVDFYSFVPATKRFTLLKRATAMYKSAPVIIAANQFVDLPANNAAYFIYADSTGTLYTTATPSFETNILLFSIISDGTYYAVSKQTHPAKFPSTVAEEWHTALGSSMENDGLGVLTLLSGAGRTAKTVGTTTYHDNGLDTSVIDSGGNAITMKMFYTGVAGVTLESAGFTAVPGYYQNGTALSGIPSGKYVNYRVGVYAGNNLDTSSPNNIAQYAVVPDTILHAGASAAANAITANNVAAFHAPLKTGLEVIQIGYFTMKGGAGDLPTTATLETVTPAKQTFGVNFASGSTSSAGSVTTDITTFDRLLSAADTSVQLALNTIDNNAMRIASSHTFNATTSWGVAAGGFYTFTIAAATHLRGTTPVVRCRYDTPQVTPTSYEVVTPSTFIATNGDVSIKVPDVPDLRFAGNMQIFG